MPGIIRNGLASLAGFALLLAGCAMLPPPAAVQRTPSQAVLASPDTALGRIASASLPERGLSGFRLLPTGPFAYDTRIALAQRAEATLDVQYYHVANDDSGRHLLRTLRDAADRGVRVRLLLDDLYTADIEQLLLALAATPNVEVRLFNPFAAGRGGVASRFAASLNEFGRVNHRMHNKLYIADGAFAVAGGRNVADGYYMRDGVANFVDLDTAITGALVPQLQFLFDYYWNSPFVYPLHAVVEPLADAARARRRFDAATGAATTRPPPAPADNDVLGYAPLSQELGDPRIGFIWATADAYADPPEKIAPLPPGMQPMRRPAYLDQEAVRFNVLDLLRGAQQEVVLTSPYLIPGEKGIALMRELRARGVRIKLLTNSLASTDEPLVHTGYARYRKQMLRMGVELYELSPTRVQRDVRLGMFGSSRARLHAKTAVIDRRQVFIGSMNFDPRSDKHNTEMGIFVDSPALAREMLRLVDLDKLQSAYRVSLGADGDSLRWSATGDDGEVMFDSEPDAGPLLQLWLRLLAPLAPEELL